jgi:hypothetical protein
MLFLVIVIVIVIDADVDVDADVDADVGVDVDVCLQLRFGRLIYMHRLAVSGFRLSKPNDLFFCVGHFL